MTAMSSNPLVGKTVCDFEHVARALAMRYRVGAGYAHDVRERWKAKAWAASDVRAMRANTTGAGQ